jgi:YidC/Oxa1 family membrane protein insertase
MALATERLVLTPQKPKGELVLTGAAEGLEISERMSFDAANYTVRVGVEVRNPGAEPRALAIALPWVSRRRFGDEPERFPGQRPIEIAWSVDGHVDRAPHAMSPTLDSIDAAPGLGREGNWIAIGSVWYLAALLPRSPGFVVDAAVERPETEPPKGPSGWVSVALRATPTVAPGQTWRAEALMYVGPKEYEEIRGLGLEETLNFGGFPLPWYYGGLPMRWIGVPILLLMKWLYGFIGNYGIAIILLTVVSKVLFYPLTVKGMKSMKAMQALQPQINALRTKYKSDPQRIQRETLELYRKHRVNPAGGCLPMLAQVPIFYALYLALSVSVELQNAQFICVGQAPSWMPLIGGGGFWICDLAAKDPIYVLPILMGVTMFVQQKISPQVGDPRQAKMMLVMPFVFTLMFLELPSGLVLYWTVSNVLQILQQWYMDRPRARGATREVKDASGG